MSSGLARCVVLLGSLPIAACAPSSVSVYGPSSYASSDSNLGVSSSRAGSVSSTSLGGSSAWTVASSAP